MNCLHFFPLGKVLFTTSITFSRGKKSRYCHIIDNQKERNLMFHISCPMSCSINHFLTRLFNFWIVYLSFLLEVILSFFYKLKGKSRCDTRLFNFWIVYISFLLEKCFLLRQLLFWEERKVDIVILLTIKRKETSCSTFLVPCHVQPTILWHTSL